MTDYDSEIVHAYGGVHFSVPYEDAVDIANWIQDRGARLLIVRVDDGFELVCFDDEARQDSDYVSMSVGRRLYSEGRVGVLVTYGGPDEEPKTEEAFAALEHEQVWG